MKNKHQNIAIIGAGRLGQSIAKGLVASKLYKSSEIILTKRDISSLNEFEKNGYQVTSDNKIAIKNSEILIFSVGPRDLESLLNSEKNNFSSSKHIIVSTVAGINIDSNICDVSLIIVSGGWSLRVSSFYHKCTGMLCFNN